MLTITEIEHSIKVPIVVNKNNTIDKVGGNNKVGGVKFVAKKDLKSDNSKHMV